ncbi:hypothetical protein F4810DRAFT_684531 [Camillea tinctor]|nr:hypothetical protein F4810DRAFT_684531 [Camillea tinctor]
MPGTIFGALWVLIPGGDTRRSVLFWSKLRRPYSLHRWTTSNSIVELSRWGVKWDIIQKLRNVLGSCGWVQNTVSDIVENYILPVC